VVFNDPARDSPFLRGRSNYPPIQKQSGHGEREISWTLCTGLLNCITLSRTIKGGATELVNLPFRKFTLLIRFETSTHHQSYLPSKSTLPLNHLRRDIIGKIDYLDSTKSQGYRYYATPSRVIRSTGVYSIFRSQCQFHPQRYKPTARHRDSAPDPDTRECEVSRHEPVPLRVY
jgi:hypothetical protein